MVEGTRLSNHIPTLDGWRALAIIAVICFHGRFAFFPNPSIIRSISEYGYLGVDAFFAISGFLICTLLVREYDGNRSINLRGFYILACACLSHYLLERPMMRLGGRLSSRQPVSSNVVLPVPARAARPATHWVGVGFSMHVAGGGMNGNASATVARDS
jgi:peptidoglycan/LPS O-acetylase OafA/YrhL